MRRLQYLLFSLAFLGGFLSWSSSAVAQTPAATIENGNGSLVLESYWNGSLYVPGNFGPTTPADSIPATGAGTRLMWYPAKAAFRAGRVGEFTDGTQWDASKVGDYSVALGRDTKASGLRSVAMGGGTVASSDAATATGALTTASGRGSVAMGIQTTAGAEGAVALGNSAKATGQQAGTVGFGTIAKTNHSFTLGKCNKENSPQGGNALFVVGNGTITTGSCQRGASTADLSDALVLDGSGNLTISGTLSEGSDRRLKMGIEPLGSGILDQLAQLRPVRYQFKNQDTHPTGEQIGLVAQDVRKEFPELVNEGSDGMLSLAYSKLTAVLLKGVQEQQTQIDRQKAQIDRQQTTIDSLKQRVREIGEVKKRLAAVEARQAAGANRVAGWTGGPLGLVLAGLLGGLATVGALRIRQSG